MNYDGLRVIIGKHDNYVLAIDKISSSEIVLNAERDKLSFVDCRFGECVILKYAGS